MITVIFYIFLIFFLMLLLYYLYAIKNKSVIEMILFVSSICGLLFGYIYVLIKL